ncbi:MAG: signal protein PDZ [Flavobacterium sp. BFFFF1]|uniref:aspartyl protease family protein n=1 Tax=Flavobacterium sp. BFFFF1 TaxID=2015557 RepID=UPI000BD520FD|nr:aspartyl protease family protein [Flavobacterium sp. BFFFF1]OYU80136.1 MAG: signal protein PDZ [Flavobacterium sp. BFFFF1]
MKTFLAIICTIFCAFLGRAQEGFSTFPEKNKVILPFKLVNNLVIIPVSVNGVELSFLLDSGVEETILFSLDEKDEVPLYDVEKITLRGLGNQEGVEGLKSKNNTLELGGLGFKHQEILIVIDELMNLSSSLGMPVNGIIGYQFFRDYLVKINYARKKLVIYNRAKTNIGKLTKDYTPLDITIERNKPYVISSVKTGDDQINAKLLLDTGNSDAIWLFDKKSDKINIPERNFDDFLGRGFSGPVFGKKARITDFKLDDFHFTRPVVSFPDTVSLRNVKMVDDRLGSIGGEVLKRFHVILDYKNSKFYLRKNANFDLPFHCNTSGIELHHVGLKMVQEKKQRNGTSSSVKIEFSSGNEMDIKYQFELKPVYEIASVRKGSPADVVGIKQGDVLLTINNSQSYRYTLEEINEMLKSDDGRKLLLEVQRDNTILKFKLEMKSVL